MQVIVQLYREAYKGLSRQTWFLSLVILINRSGTMVVPFMTMYATQKLGFSIVQAGLIMALFGAGSIVGAFIGGKITDTFGFYKVQVISLFGGGCMFIMLGYLTTFAGICVGTFLLSTINESFRPAHSTAIAYYSLPINRTRSYALNRLAINLGWAFGGALGGLLASINYSLIFWVDGITNISAAILLVIVLPAPIKHVEKATPSPGDVGESPKHKTAYGDPLYRWFILLTVLFAFCFFQMFTILPLYLKQELRLNEKQIGVLMACNGIIIALVEMVLVFSIEKSGKQMRFIAWGVWLVGLSYGLYNVLQGHFMVALISIIVITIGEMLCMPFMNSFWIGRSSDNNRGQYAALYTMAWGTAQIAAPSFGGWIADTYSFNVLWWIIFAITIAAGMGYSKLMQVTHARAVIHTNPKNLLNTQ